LLSYPSSLPQDIRIYYYPKVRITGSHLRHIAQHSMKALIFVFIYQFLVRGLFNYQGFLVLTFSKAFTSCTAGEILGKHAAVSPLEYSRHSARVANSAFNLQPASQSTSSSSQVPSTIALPSESPEIFKAERQSDYPSPNGSITLFAWTEPNCKGLRAQTQFNSVTFTKNNSNFYISRSFQLSRPLMGQEQLDLSLATNLKSWNATKSQSLRSPNPACNIFERTYFAWNGRLP
jgi:hypothetical protein